MAKFQERNPGFLVRDLDGADRTVVRAKIKESWGSEIVGAKGTIYHPEELPGFCALIDEEIVGILTYTISFDSCEIVTLNSWRGRIGIGSALIHKSIQAAKERGCWRIWLITTNDNLNALRFYQKRGFTISAIHLDVIAASHTIKPEIPMTGENGIPIRDEIELEMTL
jgi:ribosomal protein S18 acetylase RimI-like enzyme